MNSIESLREKLSRIRRELCDQQSVAKNYDKDTMPFAEQTENLREYIEEAREYSITYEAIVAILEKGANHYRL